VIFPVEDVRDPISHFFPPIFIPTDGDLIPPSPRPLLCEPLQVDYLDQRMKKVEEDLLTMRDTIATQEELAGVHEVMKPVLSRILETVKEAREREEATKVQASKKIKELEERLAKLEPLAKRKRRAVSPLIYLPLDLLKAFRDLLLSPFTWTPSPKSSRSPGRPEEGPEHGDTLRSPSRHRRPSWTAVGGDENDGEEEEEGEPLKIQRRRDSKGKGT